MQELGKPGRDPREKFEAFKFSDEARSIDDLREGMRLPGIVTNVTAFGAFIDIGVHQDGLAHISELADFFVRDPKACRRRRGLPRLEDNAGAPRLAAPRTDRAEPVLL